MAPTYLTQEGLDKLKAELVVLRTKTRQELADRIELAKSMGDLSENAEYHEAKDTLSMVEARIREIEAMLKTAAVIQDVSGGDDVRVGSQVEVEVHGKTKSYKIVGSNEADPVAGLISNESPIGQAFLGHKVGERVEAETPAGITMYKILKIS
jgi:transcription elongation factor GreA